MEKLKRIENLNKKHERTKTDNMKKGRD